MKKQVLILLLITILLNGLILFFLFSAGEYGAKLHYAFSKQSPQKEITFLFTELEFKLCSHDKNELSINNQVYDIVTLVKENGLIKVTCLLDKHETFFVNLLQSNSSALTDMKSQKNIIHLLQYLTLVSCDQAQIFQFCLYQQEQHLAEDSIFYFNHSYELDSPPPQV